MYVSFWLFSTRFLQDFGAKLVQWALFAANLFALCCGCGFGSSQCSNSGVFIVAKNTVEYRCSGFELLFFNQMVEIILFFDLTVEISTF